MRQFVACFLGEVILVNMNFHCKGFNIFVYKSRSNLINLDLDLGINLDLGRSDQTSEK